MGVGRAWHRAGLRLGQSPNPLGVLPTLALPALLAVLIVAWTLTSASAARAATGAAQEGHPALPAGLARAVRRAFGPETLFPRQTELRARGGRDGDTFGAELALNSSGTIALIGAYHPYPLSGPDRFSGVAYVFARSGSRWIQQAELRARDARGGDSFGGSVALNSSGTIALVGAQGKNYATGAVYVFTRSGSRWTQRAELTARGGADAFGQAVALNASGSTALIGAFGASTGSMTGASFVFTGSGSRWTQRAVLTASNGASNDGFGEVVALDALGTTALVAAPNLNGGTGAAYVFTGSGSAWTQQAELTAGDAAPGDLFGSVALSASGTTALIGAPGKDGATGAVYVFTRSGSSWTQQAEITARDAASNDGFGIAVALTTSGGTALIGADGNRGGRGTAYVFTRSGSKWTQRTEIAARNGADGDFFGSAVVLSAFGKTALVGAMNANRSTGAAYVFT